MKQTINTLTTNEMIQKVFYKQDICSIDFMYKTNHNGNQYKVTIIPTKKSRRAHVFYICINENKQTYTNPLAMGTVSKKAA